MNSVNFQAFSLQCTPSLTLRDARWATAALQWHWIIPSIITAYYVANLPLPVLWRDMPIWPYGVPVLVGSQPSTR